LGLLWLPVASLLAPFGCLWLPFSSRLAPFSLPFALFNCPSASFSCIFRYVSSFLFVSMAFCLKFDPKPYFSTHLNSILTSTLLRTLLRSIPPTLWPTYLARCGICRRHLDKTTVAAEPRWGTTVLQPQQFFANVVKPMVLATCSANVEGAPGRRTETGLCYTHEPHRASSVWGNICT